MKLEIGKLYKRIDGGYLHFIDYPHYTDIKENPLLLIKISKIETSASNGRGEVIRLVFLFKGRLCWVEFTPSYHHDLIQGKIFKEVI